MGRVRIGVLGGTFNPIHNGHLHIARSCQRLFSLSQVRFAVAAAPPHKSPEDLIPLMHRYAMVSVATSRKLSFVPSLIELEPPASSFSIDTLRKLASRIDPSRTFLYFIAGGDSLAEVKSWRESEMLLNSCSFIFVLRPGTGDIDPGEVLPQTALSRVRNLAGLSRVQMRLRIEETPPGENRIFIVGLDAPDISATGIRLAAAAGKSIKSSVPTAVCDYIRKFQLYGER